MGRVWNKGDGRTKAHNHAIVVVWHLINCCIQVRVGVALFTLAAELLVFAARELRQFPVIAGCSNFTPARLCRDIEACWKVCIAVLLARHCTHRSKKVRITLACLDLEAKDNEGKKNRDDGEGDEENSRLHAPVFPHPQNQFLTLLSQKPKISYFPQPTTPLLLNPHLSSHLPIEDTTAAASAAQGK